MMIESSVEGKVESIPQRVKSETQLIVVLNHFNGR